MAAGNNLSDFSADIKINGEQAYYEMKTIALPLSWQDETKDFPKDGYGDESAPQQKSHIFRIIPMKQQNNGSCHDYQDEQ